MSEQQLATKPQQQQTQDIAQRQAANKKGIAEWLDSDKFKHQIAAVLPRHVTPERMVRAAITATMRTPDLAKCDQASFFNQMLLLSQFGLEPDGRRAHLIPFWNTKRGVFECQLIIDYKGLVELILRTGNVSTIHADKICENDEFVYDCGQVERHRIDFRKPRGEAYAYYCIITRKDGTRKCEVMSVDEVAAIRARSKSGNSGPWVTDFDEMAKKTVFKRASKWVELSSEIRELVDADSDLIVDGAVVRSNAMPDKPRGVEGLKAALGDSSQPEATTGGEVDGDEFERSARVRGQYLEQLSTTVKIGALKSLMKDAAEDELLSEADKAAVVAEIEERIVIAQAT
jgi:recombination protein RecT